MAVPARRGRPTTAKAAPARKPAARPAAPSKRKRDVTEYASKPATAYHKAFAKWIVTEIGFDPDSAPSRRAAFLKGVSIATAARPAFNESDFIEEWRETSGEAKRGPKPKAPVSSAAAKRRRPEPEPVEEDEIEEDDDDFEDEEIESDDVDDDESDDEDSDDDDFDEEEEEPAPAPRRGRPAKAAPAKPAARKAAPAKAASTRKAKPAAPADDDDDFIF